MTRMARAHFGRQLREHTGHPRHPRNPRLKIFSKKQKSMD
jgi:hypothetical protein